MVLYNLKIKFTRISREKRKMIETLE